ncbi:hypothetical protein [Aliikangiella maris]|uniref:Uncharacterized protein n=2 Tax=Aliikangiella maris TaxID=3162458 RepID=A0ABV2BVE4_9GAMM
MFKKCFYILIAYVSINTVNAAEFLGNVQEFYVNNQHTAQLNLKQGNSDNKPGCNPTNGWDFTFLTNTDYGNQWVSMLLAAKMADKAIRVGYNGNQNGTCEVTYLYFPREN